MGNQPRPWLSSLHGGHSGEFCDHAEGTLLEILERAESIGCTIYGVSEHAARVHADLLYAEEVEMGWTTDTLMRLFESYAARVDELARAFRGRMTVLRGFETEVVPTDGYAEVMLGLRDRFDFDYIVGSVHHVDGQIIDYRKDGFDAAVARHGSLEAMCVRYYEIYREMLLALRPEVAAHFDLVRRHAPDEAAISTPRVMEAAFAALEAAKKVGAILDVNTSGYRKGIGRPYPAPWILSEARRLDLPVCSGDDAHRPSEVAYEFDAARAYLLENGYHAITTLEPAERGLRHLTIPLLPGVRLISPGA